MPIGLVENQVLNGAKGKQPLVHQVEKAARRGDDDIDAAVQGAGLGLLADAAVNDRAAQWQVLAVGAKLVADLDGQLTRRRQNQGARLSPPARAAFS